MLLCQCLSCNQPVQQAASPLLATPPESCAKHQANQSCLKDAEEVVLRHSQVCTQGKQSTSWWSTQVGHQQCLWHSKQPTPNLAAEKLSRSNDLSWQPQASRQLKLEVYRRQAPKLAMCPGPSSTKCLG